jgi:hypothetical protein
LDDYVEFNDNGQVTGFNYGPQKGYWLPWITLLSAKVLIDCLQTTDRIAGVQASPIQRFLEQRQEEMVQRYHKSIMLDARGNP